MMMKGYFVDKLTVPLLPLLRCGDDRFGPYGELLVPWMREQGPRANSQRIKRISLKEFSAVKKPVFF